MAEEVPRNVLVEALEQELAAASTALINNSDFLRGILSGCGDCIKILDLEGRLQFMSDGGKRVMEVENFSQLKGCPWPEFWEGQGNTDATEAVRAAVNGQSARFRGAANTAKGNPRYWDVQVSPILDAHGKPSHLLSISKDITQEWEAEQRRSFLAQELQHRVKNTLATVISIANQTFRGETFREARAAFNTRLVTLSRAHDILTESNWGNTSVRKIIEAALEPHTLEGVSLRIDGPEVDLDSRQALALALATNELATNAAKYGPLRRTGGKVDISWSIAEGDRRIFVWKWRESGGPPVFKPAHAGFGSRVIKDFLAEELNGSSEISFEATGLVCTVRVPVENFPLAK